VCKKPVSATIAATLTFTTDAAHQPVAPVELMLLSWEMRVINPILVAQFLSLSLLVGFLDAIDSSCQDLNPDCREWVLTDRAQCNDNEYVKRTCLRACGICISSRSKRRFDANQLPPHLKPLEFLVGVWRSNDGGKAVFPTIPKFTYGEQVEFSVASPALSGSQSINYTAFAWSMDRSPNSLPEELHSESGFITMKGGTAALTTVMNNGFVTVEQGSVGGGKIRLRLVDIGRISFSRDLPVHDLIREWTLLDRRTLEARLSMGTLTHGLREHTFITYTKIFP